MDKILKFTLPEQISGSFSFDYNEDSDIKLINIEAKDDKWYLYTTDDVNVIYNNSITDGLYLELNNYYLLQKNSQNFLIYVSAVFDNTFN